MRTAKSLRTGRKDEAADVDTDDETYETYEIYRVNCPDCGQSIALLANEEVLPQHARCATRWNPFGLTVCTGTGREVAAIPASGAAAQAAHEEDAAVLLTLPEGLDWRMQPFSHAGGPGSRAVRLPSPLQRA